MYKMIILSLLIFCNYTTQANSGLPRVLVVECNRTDKCKGNSICKMQLYLPYDKYLEHDKQMSGQLLMRQGLEEGPNDSLLLDVSVNLVEYSSYSLSFRMRTLNSYPPVSYINIENVKEGQVVPGTFQYRGDTRIHQFICKRFKDPR